jgi:hypothetical protein
LAEQPAFEVVLKERPLTKVSADEGRFVELQNLTSWTFTLG